MDSQGKEDIFVSDVQHSECRKCFGENAEDKWISCSICPNKWFHCFCVGILECETDEIDQFHCSDCTIRYGPSIRKKLNNNHRYDRTLSNADHLRPQVGTAAFMDQLLKREFPTLTNVDILEAEEMNFKYLTVSGFTKPVLVKNEIGLDLRIPHHFSLDFLVDKLGEDYKVDVISVYQQQTSPMKLSDLINALKDVENRPNILNCISLELSDTSLSRQIDPPKIVRKLSWVENTWPADDYRRPHVSKYCLLSMKNSYTDFHIDFSGTSVWYHVVKGAKTFYFIEPKQCNLDAYERWLCNEKHTELFLPDLLDEGEKCYKFTLKAGQTMFIPSGWIHSVSTPQDGIIFGGNFLHSLNMQMQVNVYEMEERLATEGKFKLPYCELVHWFAYSNVLKMQKKFCTRWARGLRHNKALEAINDGITSYLRMLKNWKHLSKENPQLEMAPEGVHLDKIIAELEASQSQPSTPIRMKLSLKQIYADELAASNDSSNHLTEDTLNRKRCGSERNAFDDDDDETYSKISKSSKKSSKKINNPKVITFPSFTIPLVPATLPWTEKKDLEPQSTSTMSFQNTNIQVEPLLLSNEGVNPQVKQVNNLNEENSVGEQVKNNHEWVSMDSVQMEFVQSSSIYSH